MKSFCLMKIYMKEGNQFYLQCLTSKVKCEITMKIPRGGDTSMAGMAIAIPGVLNISKTGDTMGKIR